VSIGAKIGRVARKLDRRFGIMAMLSGEPRPPKGGFDLVGEKLVDWGWICAHLPRVPSRALEIGPGKSPIIPAMLSLGYHVTAVDASVDSRQVISGFDFIYGDFQGAKFDSKFDVIVVCSVIEHVGLSGRFNAQESPDGDLVAMAGIRSLLAPDGRLFLTLPVGSDAVHKPWHRVYGRQRLPKLLDGLEVVESRYLVKEPWGPWQEASQSQALSFPVDVRRYALGEMILRIAPGENHQ
jgi:SAM-dependent methyltransferase